MKPAINKPDKGVMGIGMLIIFIAVIIVAAIAAAIVISSSGTFGTKAIAAGKGADEEISTGMIITSVYGRNGTDGSIEYLDIIARLRSGSEPINFNTTVITIDTLYATQLCTFSRDNTTDTGKFYVNYLQESMVHIAGYLSLGDTAIITLNLQDALYEHMPITIQIIPRVGGITKIQFTTPTSILYYRIFLYP